MAGKNYVIKSVTDGTGAISGVQDVSIEETTESVTKKRADTSITTESVHLDGLGARITVTTTDLSAGDARSLGNTGSLTIVRQHRAAGTGAVSMGDVTATFASVCLVGKSEGTPHEGEATLNLTYEAYDTSGASVVTYS